MDMVEMTRHARDVDEYISGAPEESRAKLIEVRETIRKTAPQALERISYGMPYYSFKGQLAWFGLHTAHIGVYFRPPLVEVFKYELKGYTTTKSAVHFPLKKPVPLRLLAKLIKARVKMNEESEWR